MIDRIVHHADVISFKGNSYRLKKHQPAGPVRHDRTNNLWPCFQLALLALFSVGAKKLANQALTEVRQQLSHQMRAFAAGQGIRPGPNGCCCSVPPILFSEPARTRLERVFATDHPTGKLRAAWNVKEQVRVLLRTGSLADAAAAKDRLKQLVKESGQPETTQLWRTVGRWWKEIEVLIVTGATTGKVQANNTSIKRIKRTGRGFVNSTNCTTHNMLRSDARTAVNHPLP